MLTQHATVKSITESPDLIATQAATSVTNAAPGVDHFKHNTNPAAHGDCGDKAHRPDDGELEGVAAEHVDVVPPERGEVGDVLVADVEAVRAQLGHGGVHVPGVEEHKGVEDQAQGADLVLSELAQLTARRGR